MLPYSGNNSTCHSILWGHLLGFLGRELSAYLIQPYEQSHESVLRLSGRTEGYSGRVKSRLGIRQILDRMLSSRTLCSLCAVMNIIAFLRSSEADSER